MNKDFIEFKNKVIKLGHKTKYAVRQSFGVYDCYKWIRKHNWLSIGKPVSEKDYYAIIRGVNDYLAERLKEGKTVVFPYNMGKLELRKFEPNAYKKKNGSIKITHPVCWIDTLKLWYEDEEAYLNKTLVRSKAKTIYFIKYNKFGVDYENKVFYVFNLNRFIKRAIIKNANEGKLETLW